ncbi:MAG: SPFH domain-containing protein [Lachnospiraceae bacterium]|nr:SPFH domain-containing protein [Lachnospiraceae bacterium]
MGLIKVAANALGALGNAVNTTGSSLWVEYFESGDMSGGILMKRGVKISTAGSKNTKGDQNIISSGSGIDVQENQCMILVENGRIVDFCAEPGRYTFDASAAPSLMSGDNKGLKALAAMIGSQFLAGGSRTNTQRVFYINLGEIQGFKWGSGNITFDHWESDIATGKPVWHIATTLQGNGMYSIQVTDPAKFFSVLGAQKAGADGNGLITKDDIEPQIKTEAIAAIRQGVGQMSKLHIPYTEIAANEFQLTKDVDAILDASWQETRGISIFRIAIGMMDADPNSKQKIEKYQETKGYTDPSMLGAAMGLGQTEAMQTAAGNTAGAVTGFAGVGMMGGLGSGQANIAGLMQQGQAQQAQTAPAPAQQAAGWTCTSCGAVNSGNFCTNCGSPKPAAGKACGNCGYMAPDPANPPKFCPNCGTKWV